MLVQYLKGTLYILDYYRISEATMAWFKKKQLEEKNIFFKALAKPDDYSYCILHSICNSSIFLITTKKKENLIKTTLLIIVILIVTFLQVKEFIMVPPPSTLQGLVNED